MLLCALNEALTREVLQLAKINWQQHLIRCDRFFVPLRNISFIQASTLRQASHSTADTNFKYKRLKHTTRHSPRTQNTPRTRQTNEKKTTLSLLFHKNTNPIITTFALEMVPFVRANSALS